MKDLEDIQKKETEQMKEQAQKFTPRGEKLDKDEDNGDGTQSSNTTFYVLGAAILVAGLAFAYKKIQANK